MNINRNLIEKYNKPVPRYTSYPPANFFRDDFGAASQLKAIEDSNSQQPDNISIYIHIPFCKKLCFYCGCNSCPMAKPNEVKQYIEALKKEIKLVIPLLSRKRKISQIHYGGGTPNSIPVEYIQEINQIFFDNFKFIDNPEIAIECHPAYLDQGYIDRLKKAGFNRFSLGIQDFNADVLKAVNREPSKIPLDDLSALLKEGTNSAINFDFIYGLPFQTKNSFIDTITKAIELKPERLVTFSYAHVPWVNKAQLVLEKKGLPNGMQKIDMTESAFNLLGKTGYKSIGMDHYVLESDELFAAQQGGNLHRNFQGYCTLRTTGQVYAFGVSGISQLTNNYAQNTKSIQEYVQDLNNGKLPIRKGYTLNSNEKTTRAAISGFMCNKVLHWSSLADKLGISKSELMNATTIDNEALKAFQKDGIVEMFEGGLKITENGLPFIRNVAASFDPLLKTSKNSFSKAV